MNKRSLNVVKQIDKEDRFEIGAFQLCVGRQSEIII